MIQTFQEYILEASKNIQDLDIAFIKRAEVVTSFNVTSKDFESLKNKSEIQYLFKKHFFPDFNLDMTLKTFNDNQFNSLVNDLKSQNKQKFNQLLKYQPKGVGPGEVLMYFLVDDVQLGGGSSAGLDVVSGGKGYEVKAVNLTKEGYFADFKIGGTVNISAEMKAASDIKKQLGLPGRETEINKTQIKAIKASEYAKEWINNVEIPYQKKAYSYFKGHDTIFIINSNPVSLVGQCFVKTISLQDIVLSNVTAGTIKPEIRK